jgi:two-component system chemotaxis response regulator CheY
MDPKRLAPPPRPTVLVVVDHGDLRDAISVLFEAEGYAVADAANGREALTYLESERPVHAIILDLVMPVMDGWEFLVEWRTDARSSQIPLVVLTGVSPSHLRPEELTGLTVMTKPFAFDELVATVRRLVIRQVWDKASHPHQD